MKMVLTTETDPQILNTLYSVARFHGQNNKSVIDDTMSDDTIVASIRKGRYGHEDWSFKVRDQVLREYFLAYYGVK